LKLESLPPTSAPAAQHSLRTSVTVQQWRESVESHKIGAFRTTFWSLVESDKDVAPSSILNLVSYKVANLAVAKQVDTRNCDHIAHLCVVNMKVATVQTLRIYDEDSNTNNV